MSIEISEQTLDILNYLDSHAPSRPDIQLTIKDNVVTVTGKAMNGTEINQILSLTESITFISLIWRARAQFRNTSPSNMPFIFPSQPSSEDAVVKRHLTELLQSRGSNRAVTHCAVRNCAASVGRRVAAVAREVRAEQLVPGGELIRIAAYCDNTAMKAASGDNTAFLTDHSFSDLVQLSVLGTLPP